MILFCFNTKHHTLNAKLTNSQLNKLKSGMKNVTEVALNLSSSLIRNSNGKTNFLHKLFSTDTQVSKIYKAFANGSSANIILLKTQLSKMIQSEGILDESLVVLPYEVLKVGTQELIKISPELVKEATRHSVDKSINGLKIIYVKWRFKNNSNK